MPSSDLADAPQRLRFGPFLLDAGERRLTHDGQPVVLASRYFDLLVALAGRPGRLVDKATLFAEVWPGVVVGDAALSQGIRAVRVALGDEAAAPRFVETVAGHGYRFIAPVEPAESPASDTSPAPDVSAAPLRDDADAVPTVQGGALPTSASSLAPEAEPPGHAALPPSIPPVPDALLPVAHAPADRLDERPAAYAARPTPASLLAPRSELLSRTGAVTGTLAASLVGGVLYGAAIGGGGPHPMQTVASVTAMSMAVGGLGAAAVASGARVLARRGTLFGVLGGGLGGALVGLVGAYVGYALLMLFTGRAPAMLTGPAEGLLIGMAVAAGPMLVKDRTLAAVTSAALALVVFGLLAASGRPTFIGSLEHTLALPDAPLRLDGLAPGGLTHALRTLLSAFEGALFGLGFGAGAVVRRDG